MPTFDLNTAQKVAHLARLALSDEEMAAYAPQMGQILAFVQQLSQVNTDQVEPLANVANIPLRLRDDVVSDGGYQSDILLNAPEAVEGYFVVQKVVE